MDFSIYQIIWISAAAVFFMGWPYVSFNSPSRGRTVVEWTSATAMYVGLLTFFVYHGLDAWAEGKTVLLIAFGLLCVMFGCGLLVSLWNTLAAMGGERKEQGSATH